ncbi:MAG: esterase [Gallionella sp.]|nr:esterase [Gallionella sp.]
MDRKIWKLAASVLVVFSVAACAPFQQYRTVYPEVCISPAQAPSPECETHALQQLPSGNGNRYLLGFIEFDDQGQLWDRKQMWDVVGKLAGEAGTKELLMVVFVHGWKHSAAPGDGNIQTFSKVLAQLSDAEAQIAKLTGTPPREVAGVYLGWRGGSVTVPLLKELTFWDRKNTAQKVGHGGVTEVLSRLELIKQDKESTAPGQSRTRLVVVGHSFGGAVVSTALAQILESRFVQTTGPAGIQSDIAGFADLVVLINPAIEAMQFAPLSDMATERGTYFASQLPAVLELTSEADYATRYAFPVGRWLSTWFEMTHDRKRWNAVTRQQETIDESDANITAVGHFEPYRTHQLKPSTVQERAQLKELSTADSLRQFTQSSADWAQDKPGSKISFGDVMLERTTTSAGRNPYLLTYVDKNLITDHNDIDDPRIIEFVKQLILISTQSPEQAKAIKARPVSIDSGSMEGARQARGAPRQ